MSDVEPQPRRNRGASPRLTVPSTWPENVWVAVALAVFFAAFTLHTSVANLDRALHHDVLEAYAWGREFRPGYHQHGPFWPWIAGAWFLLFPNRDIAFELLESLNITIGLWGAWLLIGLFVSGKARYAAALLLLGTPFYTFLAYRYNANTIFISLWPWTLYFFVRSVDYMKMRDALLFGLLAAACLLSKYYAVTILITCALSLVFHPNGRRYILSPLPWAAAALFIVCVSPHIIWSLQNGAPPVTYAMNLTGRGIVPAIGWASRTLIDAAAYHVLVAAIILAAWWWSRSSGTAGTQPALPPARRKFLAVLALTPVVLTAMFALVFSLKSSAIMALGTFPLVPLFLMQLAPRLDAGCCFRLALAWALTITIGAAAASPVERAIVARTSKDATMVQPRRELAERATEIWRAETGVPLRYAGATVAYSNGISFYSKDRPSSFAGLEFERAEWVTPAKLKQYGLLIACPDNDADCLKKAPRFLSGKWKQFSIGIGREVGSRRTPEVRFEIYVVPPQAGQEMSPR
jgi:hypothetical protein